MRAKGSIEINKIKYKYQFKMKARRLFMEMHGLEYMEDYEKKVKEMIPKKGKSMSLSGWYVFANLLLTAIQSEYDDVIDITADDVLDSLMHDQEKLQSIMQAMNSSNEKPEKEKPSVGSGKSKARG